MAAFEDDALFDGLDWYNAALAAYYKSPPARRASFATRNPPFCWCRDALERAAVKGQLRATQQVVSQHWPLGYPLPAPTAPALCEQPKVSPAIAPHPVSTAGPAAEAVYGQHCGGAYVAGHSGIGASRASQGNTVGPRLAMASAQLSSSPLMEQLVRQHHGHHAGSSTGGIDQHGDQHICQQRAQSTPAHAQSAHCCSMPELMSNRPSQSLRTSGSQQSGSHAIAQRQWQHGAAAKPAASAPAQQGRPPPRQVCSMTFLLKARTYWQDTLTSCDTLAR